MHKKRWTTTLTLLILAQAVAPSGQASLPGSFPWVLPQVPERNPEIFEITVPDRAIRERITLDSLPIMATENFLTHIKEKSTQLFDEVVVKFDDERVSYEEYLERVENLSLEEILTKTTFNDTPFNGTEITDLFINQPHPRDPLHDPRPNDPHALAPAVVAVVASVAGSVASTVVSKVIDKLDRRDDPLVESWFRNGLGRSEDTNETLHITPKLFQHLITSGLIPPDQVDEIVSYPDLAHPILFNPTISTPIKDELMIAIGRKNLQLHTLRH